MQVSSTITINTAEVNQLCELAKTALVQTAEALHTEVVQAEVMPRDMGTLQNESAFVDSSQISVDKVSIASSTPCARRLYFRPEYNFRRDKNSAAGGEWFGPWILVPNQSSIGNRSVVPFLFQFGNSQIKKLEKNILTWKRTFFGYLTKAGTDTLNCIGSIHNFMHSTAVIEELSNMQLISDPHINSAVIITPRSLETFKFCICCF